jgi:hypothetical protein
MNRSPAYPIGKYSRYLFLFPPCECAACLCAPITYIRKLCGLPGMKSAYLSYTILKSRSSLSGHLFGQTISGTIVGTVHDAPGAVVIGARVISKRIRFRQGWRARLRVGHGQTPHRQAKACPTGASHSDDSQNTAICHRSSQQAVDTGLISFVAGISERSSGFLHKPSFPSGCISGRVAG